MATKMLLNVRTRIRVAKLSIDCSGPAVRIQGIIPSGSSFSLDPPENATSYNWTVNIASTTRFLLFIEDAEGELSTVSPVQ